MNKTVLVIAAHPDDELLGCGGTIVKHVKDNDKVFVLIACEGESVRYTDSNFQANFTEEAAQILGISKVYRLNKPDQLLDAQPLLPLIQEIENVIKEVQPNIIYTHYSADSNQDHQRLFNGVIVAARPVFECIEEIYAYYTVSSTEWGYPRTFVPDTWVDITAEIDTKISAFEKYESEIKPYPHPRSIKALYNMAAFYGNQVLMEYAEVFMTIRRIKRG